MLAFVYGTLTDADRVAEVVEAFAFVGPATLEGLHRVDGDYPTLAPGGRVDGRLLRTDDPAALDAYEGVDVGLYIRVSVPVAGADAAAKQAGGGPGADGRRDDAGVAADAATVYVGDPDRLGATADWPGTGPFDERVRQYVRSNPVVIEAG